MVSKIGDRAFSVCTNLEKVSMGDNLTSISTSSFNSCTSLIEFAISEKNEVFSAVDGVLVNKDKTVLVLFPFGKSADVTIPSGIKVIGERVFADNESIKKITIPDHVTTILSEAFMNCINLHSVILNNHMDSIGPNAFQGCKKLTSIELPENLSHIADSVFLECTALESINIPDGVMTIGVSAFEHCESMKNLTLGSGVTTIGDRAFIGCLGLIQIVIPDNVIVIGNFSFYYSGARILTIGANVAEIGENAFGYMYGLGRINNRNPVPITVGYLFSNIPHNGYPPMYVPVGSGEAYKASSSWNYLEIYELEDVANEIVSDKIAITQANGVISISSAEPSNVAIFTMSGQMVYQQSASNQHKISLSRGFYFIKANQTTKKVFVE